MGFREERLNGAAVIEVCEQFVRIFCIKDIKDAQRKTFKNELLREFTGKLVIDFRRKGQTIVMNYMIGIVFDDVNMMELKVKLSPPTNAPRVEREPSLISQTRKYNCSMQIH